MPEIPLSFWVGVDEAGGIPNPGRPDVQPPPQWRLDAIDATERPRNPAIAPGGAMVAFTLDRESSDIWLLEIDGATPSQPTRLTTHRTLAAYWEDGGPVWSPNGQRVAYAHAGNVWTVSASGGVPRSVCEGSSPVWVDDTRMVITVERGATGDETDVLATVTIADAWPALLAAGYGDRGAAAVSPDRTMVVSTLLRRDDLNTTSLHVTDLATGADRTLRHSPERHIGAPAWSPDSLQVAYVDESPGWSEIFVIDADGGSLPRQLTHDEADFGQLRWTDQGDHSRIVAVRSRHGVSDLVAVDAGSGEVVVLAHGGTWSSPTVRADGSIIAAHEAHDVAPRLCRVVPHEVDPIELFAPTPASIRSASHVLPQHVSYRSFDGTEVFGWLYRPASATADTPAPAIVYPHGGPTSATGDEWDGIAQYFLDKGYAWFSVNFRGSTTYGREFERANHGVWGVRDTEDCLAAYDYLAALDWVAPERVGIFGASYGSYMALHSLVDDAQHRFACGVAKYGDCDILNSWAQGDLVGRLDLERMMGHPASNRAGYEAGSPIHRITQIEAPLLVAHGEHDDRVHPAQSIELVEALRREGKTFEYITYPTEAHGLLRTGPFMHFYGRLERFFDWYLR